MVMGNSLGNKKVEDEVIDNIDVLNETGKFVISYSRSVNFNLYGYENNKYTNLRIPYTIIKHAKSVRKKGVREACYEVFHRPDKSPTLRSMLDLWGFDTYADYLYTICELGFLEGLIPVIDFGFLTPDELKQLYDIAAIVKVPLFTDYDLLMGQDSIRSLNKSFDIKEKVLTWSSKLSFPTSTGFFAHSKIEKSQYKEWGNVIADHINEYGVIHEVVISTKPRLNNIDYKPLTPTQSVSLYDSIRSIIPDHVPVIFSEPDLKVLEAQLSNKERDIGAFTDAFLSSESGQIYWQSLNQVIQSKGLTLQQRFPLKYEFIKDQSYSKKLGQVFDAYKYKIKKALLEKQKELKQ